MSAGHNVLLSTVTTTTAAADSGVIDVSDFQWVSIIAANGDAAGRIVTTTIYAPDGSTSLWALAVTVGSSSTEGIVIGPGTQSVAGPPKVTALPILPGRKVKVAVASGTVSAKLTIWARAGV